MSTINPCGTRWVSDTKFSRSKTIDIQNGERYGKNNKNFFFIIIFQGYAENQGYAKV